VSRSRSERTALAALAVLSLAAAPARAQEPTVLDLRLPVEDLSLATASLDDSVSTAESESRVRVTLAADVLFRFDRASLTPGARSRLDEVAARIRDRRPSRIQIDGHTDSKGSNAYNLRLSRRRAAAGARWLRAELGSDTPALGTAGHGEEDPIARNTRRDGGDNPRGRACNRRVTVSFGRS
jgi:OOP family OmpA-OmpF porin